MACSWRIRHKMALGMALVVGIMGVLLTGTMKGLAGYRFSMRAIQSKLAEQEKAYDLKEAINHLLTVKDGPNRNQAAELKSMARGVVRLRLEEYRQALDETIGHGRAADKGFTETLQVEAILKALQEFEAAVNEDARPLVGVASLASTDLLDPSKKTRAKIEYLRTAAEDLLSILNREMWSRSREAQREQRASLILLLSTSGAALLCMVGLLRFFYRGLVKPLAMLEQGVSRVARGDFEHRIDIRSGDEIESFAEAYNDMAGKLNDMYRDLAQQVNERSRQLVRSERLAGVGFLAAGVAHEINNPLASIAFCSEALESRLDELFERPANAKAPAAQDREIVHKYLKMIQEEAFRCKEITQKLLAFSRGGDRKRERTELGELIQGVLDMVQHVPNSKGKTIVFQPAGRIEAWVNGQEIKQVLLNLVVNALDSMDEGGTVTIEEVIRTETVELVIRDSGCGMTEEILENIFEPFFTRSRTGKGTGLGLSISHRIITQHGGEIEASSAGPNKGSTFIVRLPIRPPETGADGNESPDPEEEFLKLSAARQERRAA